MKDLPKDFLQLSNFMLGINSDKYIDMFTQLADNAWPKPVLDEFQQKGWDKLGEGYYLVPLENISSKGKGYSYLYKGEEKLSDEIFRKGGMHTGWKGEYMELIVYKKLKKVKATKQNPYPPEFDSGIHCILDKQGTIVYRASGILSYLYLIGGCLLSEENRIINLKSNSIIVKYDGSSMSSDEYYFAKNSYNKEYPLGVYKISVETGEFEIFKKSK